MICKGNKIIIIIISLWMTTVFVQAEELARKITVTGKSEINLKAQYAAIQLEIRNVNMDMEKSYELVTQNIDLLVQRLKSLGFKNEELVISLIRQGAEYSWERESSILKGYYSACNMEIKVNQLSGINLVYKELANHKNITILNTTYGRNDEFETRNTEFQKALQAAKTKAEVMAATLNVKLGNVLTIEELSPLDYHTTRIYANSTSFDSAQNAESMSNGKVTITAVVTVVFELK